MFVYNIYVYINILSALGFREQGPNPVLFATSSGSVYAYTVGGGGDTHKVLLILYIYIYIHI